MKRILTASLPLAIAVLASAQASPRDAERRALYAWFDTLGFTDGLRGTFVEIKQSTGDRRYDPPEGSVEYGFITHGDAAHFAALSVGLEEIKSLEPPNRAGQPSLKSTARRIDLRAWLENEKTRLRRRNPGNDGPHPYYTGFGGQDLIYARIADLRGYHDLADWFYEQMPDAGGRYRSPSDDESEDLATGLKHDFADEFLQRATWAFADISVMREQLLRKFTFVLDHFPDGKTRKKAQNFADKLQGMIVGDRARKAVSTADLAAVPPEARARELVWQLENQTASEGFVPGHDSVLGGLSPFMEEGRTHGTPADKLTQLGWAAIPALIDALHDTRFIRGIEEDDWSSHQVLLVRDAAMQVLMAITFKSFAPNEEPFTTDLEAEDASRNVSAWWWSLQAKTEAQYLIDQVSAGADHCGAMVRRLIKLRPDVALAAIQSGIPRAEEMDRQNLVRSLGELSTRESAKTARDQMLNGKDLGTRLFAAEIIFKSDPEAAVDAMIREWPNARQAEPGPMPDFGVEDLERFLAGCGRPSALQVVVSEMKKPDVQTKFHVMDLLAFHFEPGDKRVPPGLRQQAANLVEDALAAELTDPEVTTADFVVKDCSFRDPRICDFAAYALARCWPRRYAFQLTASWQRSDLVCAKSLNTYRASRGLPILPLPQPREDKPISFASASIVREVVVGPSTESSALISDRAVALKGKPLTAEVIRDFFDKFVLLPPIGRPQLRMIIYRDEDANGFQITFAVQESNHRRDEPECSIFARSGGDVLIDVLWPEWFLKDEDAEKKLKAALETRLGVPVFISISLSYGSLSDGRG